MLLQDIRVVIKVAELHSITAAASHLDMLTATASAAVKRVEASLGVELFVRSTRRLRLSIAGEKYIPECQKALQLLDRAKQNMSGGVDVVEGELRIAVSSDLGRNLVAPWLDEMVERYPNVSLRLNISDSNIDFYRDAVDIAVRYGSPDDASLYGFKICNVPRVLCATPEYLKKHGTPAHPHDLASHNGLFYQLQEIIHDSWKFTDGKKEFKVKMRGDRVSNDGDLVRRWCVAGKGLAVKSYLDMAEDLLSNRVVSVMPDFKPSHSELWIICPSRQSITPAVRILRDQFREKCRTILSELVEANFLDRKILDS
ncbi:MAG: LysR family transcriptional regulator [Pseudomonadales bacterium]|nr:LysR family transcriptional regulator [Pseudomonadales bacterium]